jgi:hypothetical protein
LRNNGQKNNLNLLARGKCLNQRKSLNIRFKAIAKGNIMKRLILPILAITSVVSTFSLVNPSSASAGTIYNREVNQQERIYKGVQQGTISQHEYQNLERREERIEAQRRNYLRDGHLNRQEVARLTREENRVSKAIYRDRHD